MPDAPPVIAPAVPPTIPSRAPKAPKKSSWTLAMQWRDLLFAHWPMDPGALSALLPATTPALQLDTFEGQAWLGIVPFRMRGIHWRGWPPVPGTSAFAELNVRTYVIANGRPGVWFFSLDAASPLAVRVARRTHHLPYFDADMTVAPRGSGVAYASWRTHRGGGTAELLARYEPSGPPFLGIEGRLEHWLTERYRLFSADRAGRLHRCEIEHAPWPLQPARAEFSCLNMTRWLGLELPDSPPHLLFARSLNVHAHRLVRA